MKLTPKTIHSDIAGFRERIREAETKLSEQPASAADWKGRQRLKGQRQTLEDKIRHVKNLIALAQEALETDTI